MIKIGLTGGIGSGKTFISKIFERLKIPVFYADTEAKKLMDQDQVIINQVKNRFGNDIYDSDGINRKKLASIIFNDQNALREINEIIHPRVREYFKSWAESRKAPYSIMEAAILFESGGYKEMDYNILVYAPEKLRIKRVVERDNTTRKHVRERIANQQPDESKMKMADWIIYNDEKSMLLPQIIQIDKEIKEKI